MRATAEDAVLDCEQLRDITLDDPDLMREILQTLVEDTSRQVVLLEAAVRGSDASKCARLAHYCKGACANVGAQRAAAAMLRIERQAQVGDIPAVAASLPQLFTEMDLLRAESRRVSDAAVS